MIHHTIYRALRPVARIPKEQQGHRQLADGAAQLMALEEPGRLVLQGAQEALQHASEHSKRLYGR